MGLSSPTRLLRAVRYELRTYYFEILECARKLLIVCIPVFFSPPGGVTQLVFGLFVCFLTCAP